MSAGRDEEFRRSIRDAGLISSGDVDGIGPQSWLFERIVRGVENYVSRAGRRADVPILYFPPLLSRTSLEATGYLTSFPDLVGVVSVFHGDEAQHHEMMRRVANNQPWDAMMSMSDVALSSAVCQGVYPLVARTTVPEEGLRFEAHGYCFRHEPSGDPARLQSFRQHEFVFIGDPLAAREHSDQGLERSAELLSELGLSVEVVEANDPFFGRAGQLLAHKQRDKVLKYEIVVPVSSQAPSSVSSANYHEDHFTGPFRISAPDGAAVHSSCFGFGLERVSLALLWRHGIDPNGWPESVKGQLGLTDLADVT